MAKNVHLTLILLIILQAVGCRHCDSSALSSQPNPPTYQTGRDFWMGQNGEMSDDGIRLLLLQSKYLQDPTGEHNFDNIASEIAFDLKIGTLGVSETDLFLMFGKPDYWRVEREYFFLAYLRGDTVLTVTLNDDRFAIDLGFNTASSFRQDGWHKVNDSPGTTQAAREIRAKEN